MQRPSRGYRLGLVIRDGLSLEKGVEAAGIEPASESGLPKASTMLSSRFVLAAQPLVNRMLRDQPRKVSAPRPPA